MVNKNDPSISATGFENKTKCEEFLCKHGSLILFSSIICFLIIITILCCVYRDKLRRSLRKIRSIFIRPPSEGEPTDPLVGHGNCLSDDNKNEIHFNDLIFENCIKQGRYSLIYKGIFHNEQIAIKSLSNTNDLNQTKNLFEHEKQIYLLPFMKQENILK